MNIFGMYFSHFFNIFKIQIFTYYYFFTDFEYIKAFCMSKIIKKIISTRSSRGKDETDIIMCKPSFIEEITAT